MLVIERLCAQFHVVARQLRSRHDNRETLQVEDEYDVEDLLHGLLMLEHEVVVPETRTARGASGRRRTGFLLKLERIVMVVTLARSGLTADVLGQELGPEIEHHKSHPDCRTLVCFVYDPDGRVADPRAVERALSGDRDGLSIRVIVAPKRA